MNSSATYIRRAATSGLRPSCNVCPPPTFSMTLVRHNQTDAASKKVKEISGADKRYQLIRDILYSKDVPSTSAKPLRPLTAKSVSCPVSTNADDAKVDTIERAWALEKQKEAAAKVAELRGMYESMRAAMEELEKTDSRLFEAAKVGADKDEVVVFPRRLRVPTETPPIDGWDYEMKAGNK
ncbi:mitochondrial ribosomal protein L28-domain-containing protein [Powellomyces hirtus]|nr:mitochondrial ribosomal protein L28-domain-containing protein [Powellomyces hirtus]